MVQRTITCFYHNLGSVATLCIVILAGRFYKMNFEYFYISWFLPERRDKAKLDFYLDGHTNDTIWIS